MATPSDALRVSVLGPVRAWRGERELKLGTAQQRALFAVLAAAGGREVARNELVTAVWGATPPATAAGSVYTYISGLRRGIGRDLLTSGPHGYALRLAPEDLDSARFATLCDEAEKLRDAGDPSAAAGLLQQALGLWRGDAYAGLGGERLERERDRLAARRLAAVELRARVLTELGDDGVVAELAGLVRDHPLHEPLHELLMHALHRAGRAPEALEVYRAARRTFRAELGVDPSPALTAAYERIRAAAVPAARSAETPVLPMLPPQVRRARRDGPRPLPGREPDVARLRALAGDLAAGRGSAVLVEGEPGIGKSALLLAAFADAGEHGCQLAWTTAEQHDQHQPLRVVGRALGLTTGTPGAAVDTSDSAAIVDRVLAYVRGACALAPLVLVVDDLHWADDATLRLWDRLVAATRRLPLLLVAAARPELRLHGVARVRRSVQTRQGHVLALAALPDAAVEELVAGLVGAPPGPNLAAVIPASGGNPLGARELTAALQRRGAVRIAHGRADIPASVPVEPPRSLLDILGATVAALSPAAQEVLRMAALLGDRFAVDDLAAVARRLPFDLLPELEEALAAHVLVDDGAELGFRHPYLRQALVDSIPAPARAAMHRHTAEVLDTGGSPVSRVAEQLAAATAPVDGWVVRWLVAHHAEAALRTPRITADLLRRVLGSGRADPGQRTVLLVALVRLDFRYERRPLAEAAEAARTAPDPADRAEMRQLLAAMTYRDGDAGAAIAILDGALGDPGTPELWRTRHRVLLANFQRGTLTDLDRADREAAAVHAEAVAAGRVYEATFALQTSWLTHSIRRDHPAALAYADCALALVADRPDLSDMYFDLLDNRMFTLQNLDRLDEAGRTLREAALFAIRHRLPSGLQVAAAVQCYWTGRWDDALAEVAAVTGEAPGRTPLTMREPVAVSMLLNGIGALIAARRHDTALAIAHLDAAEMLPASDAERESCDFLLVARSLVAEQRDRPDDALRLLEPLLTPRYAPMMLRHQWLPDVVRLALARGRRDVAERAAAICADEAAREVQPARAHTATARCRALLTGDPRPALTAAEHYRRVGRTTELAAALEDAATLGSQTSAEAVVLYSALGAEWDLARVRARTRPAAGVSAA